MLRDAEILLRPLLQQDRVPMARLANNRKIWDNMRDYFPHPYLETDASLFIKQNDGQDPVMNFAIEFHGEFCGVIGLLQQTDVHRRSAELGYWLGEPFWNKGIASRAVSLVTAYGFDQLNFLRIFAGVFDYNIPSMKVLEKNGYKKESVAEKHVIKNGKVLDEHRYYRLK